MKAVCILWIGLVVALSSQRVHADVATEGEVEIRVEVINTRDFPEFQFFIHYQTYHYDMGYQPDPVQEVALGPDVVTATSSRDDASFLYARDKEGNEYVSKEQVGGVTIDHNKDVAYYLDQIEVVSVENGVVEFKVAHRKKMSSEGRVLKTKKGDAGGTHWTILVVPVLSLLGLLAFFLLRRKTARA